MSINVANLSHSFGDTAVLADISLDVGAGEIVCLFGPSGCGKTTLLRLVAGLERAQAGRIEICGAPMASADTHVPAEKRPVGIVFQDFVLFPHMTALQNVGFGLGHMPAAARDREARAQLAAVGLGAIAGRFPHQLSGGQQQRVALARAFARAPQAMLLDEPFASIDVVMRGQLRENMRRLLKKAGSSVLLVTHDPEEALQLGDRIAVIRQGRIAELASPLDLYRAPVSPEGAAMFPGALRLEATLDGETAHTAFGPVAVNGAPLGRAALSDLGGDGSVILVVHGEHAVAISDANGAGTVEDCRFSGPDFLVTLVAADGQRLVLRSTVGLELGQPASMKVDPEGVRLFPGSI